MAAAARHAPRALCVLTGMHMVLFDTASISVSFVVRPQSQQPDSKSAVLALALFVAQWMLL